VDLPSTSVRVKLITDAFEFYFNKFEQEHALDVYVFCLSERNHHNIDGLLSMWRAYGGHGTGAALVFNTDFITMKADSPLAITKVRYASQADRCLWLRQKIQEWCNSLASVFIPDDKLYIVAYEILNLIKLFALRYKHDGFLEEREWRIIYFPDHDPQNLLRDRFGYAIGTRGVEPKLKFKIQPLPNEPHETWTFSTILERIILGPSVSSPLARSSVMRMLETMGKHEFREKVVSSTIPLRPL
jgi:hypothetical protein